MAERLNRFSGKPHPRTAYLGRPAGYKCERCETDVICDCPTCGAPNCCPECCSEASQEEFDRAFDDAVMPGGFA